MSKQMESYNKKTCMRIQFALEIYVYRQNNYKNKTK